MGKDYSGVATACQLISLVAVPLLSYFGYLGYSSSPLLEIPVDKKEGAAYGCWGAAVLYLVTFILCTSYKNSRNYVCFKFKFYPTRVQVCNSTF